MIGKYLIDSMENRTLQCYLFTADTSTVVKAVRAIDDYLTPKGYDWLT